MVLGVAASQTGHYVLAPHLVPVSAGQGLEKSSVVSAAVSAVEGPPKSAAQGPEKLRSQRRRQHRRREGAMEPWSLRSHPLSGLY